MPVVGMWCVLELGSGLAVLGMMPVAQAVTVSPTGVFSAKGKLELGKGILGLSCETTFSGTVTAGGDIVVTDVRFGGGRCGRITPVGLPWKGRVDSPEQLVLHDMQVEVRAPLLGGHCAASRVKVIWKADASAAHFERVQLPPDCRLHGSLVTTTRMVIAP